MIRTVPWTTLAALLAFAPGALAAEPFSADLWSGIRPIYAKTLDHPFLTGLTDGTLPKEKFRFYLIQDSHYLRSFAQALSVLAAKAPREDWAITLNKHAIATFEAERALHNSVLASYGVRPADVAATPVAPVNHAYTSHLLARVHQGSFAEGLAALLPCYWIYWEVGKELKKKGSKTPEYQRWIDSYAADSYGADVRAVLAMMDAEAPALNPARRKIAKENFTLSARYEYLFWDMAWRLEQWLP